MAVSLHETKSTEVKYEFVKFTQINCPKCFIDFMVTEKFADRLKDSGNTFYCPMGHPQAYTATEIGELKKKLASAESSREFYIKMYQGTKTDLAVKKGQLTKLKNRVANGVCPCCKRSFQNLMNHMKNQHAEFADDVRETPEIAGTIQSNTTMTTADAVRKMGKGEFTVDELFSFLKNNGVDRKPASVQTSLYLLKHSKKLEEVSGHGMRKIYRTK